MKVQIKGSALNTAASWAAKLTPSNPAIPLTASVLLAATDELRLSATDLNTFGEVVTQSTVGSDGQIAVSARLLAAVAKTLPADSDVTLDTAPRGLEVRCGRYRASLPGLSGVDDWPTFSTPGELMGSVRTDVLGKTLARVLPAVAIEGTPGSIPEHTGVSFEVRDGALTVVALDRFRLAAADVTWQAALGTEQNRNLIAHPDLLRIAMDAADGGQNVELYTDGSMMQLASPRHRVVSRLIAGIYPRWRHIFDTPERDAVTTVAMNVDELSHAITQVGAAVEKKTVGNDVVRLAISEKEIGVFLVNTSDSTNDGSGENAVDLHRFTGVPLTVGMTYRYLLDALACMNSPMVVMILVGEGSKPTMLRPADKDGAVIQDGYGHVLMTRKLADVKVAA